MAVIALLVVTAGFVLGVKSKQSPPLGLVAEHLRSASRVGHSDMGTNRKRIESIRTQVK